MRKPFSNDLATANVNRVGSHIVLQLAGTSLPHVTVPAHKAVAIGTLSSLLRAIERQTSCSRDDLLDLL